MKKATCVWCNSIVKVPKNFDDLRQKAVCSQSCKDAEHLFTMHFSDEEINRRTHYRELTKGDEHEK